MYGAGAAYFCLEPEPTQVGRSRIRLRDLGHPEPEAPKKVAAPQHCVNQSCNCYCGTGYVGAIERSARPLHQGLHPQSVGAGGGQAGGSEPQVPGRLRQVATLGVNPQRIDLSSDFFR